MQETALREWCAEFGCRIRRKIETDCHVVLTLQWQVILTRTNSGRCYGLFGLHLPKQTCSLFPRDCRWIFGLLDGVYPPSSPRLPCAGNDTLQFPSPDLLHESTHPRRQNNEGASHACQSANGIGDDRFNYSLSSSPFGFSMTKIVSLAVRFRFVFATDLCKCKAHL